MHHLLQHRSSRYVAQLFSNGLAELGAQARSLLLVTIERVLQIGRCCGANQNRNHTPRCLSLARTSSARRNSTMLVCKDLPKCEDRPGRMTHRGTMPATRPAAAPRRMDSDRPGNWNSFWSVGGATPGSADDPGIRYGVAAIRSGIRLAAFGVPSPVTASHPGDAQ